jgi:hypothetical protein
MAAPHATPGEVATFLKVTFDPAEEQQCLMVLAAVSAIMRSRLPDLDTWIADGLTDPVLVAFCAVTMANGCIQVTEVGNVKSETHPEHTIVFRDVAESDVDLTDRWIELLTPHETRTRGGRAFSIRPGPG